MKFRVMSIDRRDFLKLGAAGGIAVAEAPPRVRYTQTIGPTALALRRSLAIRHVSGHRLVAQRGVGGGVVREPALEAEAAPQPGRALSREQRRLRGAEGRCVRAEVCAGGSIGAVDAISPLDDVEVDLQNARLGQLHLKATRDDELTQLPHWVA